MLCAALAAPCYTVAVLLCYTARHLCEPTQPLCPFLDLQVIAQHELPSAEHMSVVQYQALLPCPLQ